MSTGAKELTRAGCRLVRFGAFIRTRRQAVGLTIADVAARIGVSQAYMSNIETGRKSPTAERVLQISEVLQVAPDELLCRAGMIAGDLAAIIRKRPKVRAAMLRTVGGEMRNSIR